MMDDYGILLLWKRMSVSFFFLLIKKSALKDLANRVESKISMMMIGMTKTV